MCSDDFVPCISVFFKPPRSEPLLLFSYGVRRDLARLIHTSGYLVQGFCPEIKTAVIPLNLHIPILAKNEMGLCKQML